MSSDDPRRSTARRAIIWAALGVAVVAVAAVAWIGVRGALAYGHLRSAQAAIGDLTGQLTDPQAAAATLASVGDDTSAARGLTDDIVFRAASTLPWAGPQLAAVSTVSAAVDDVVSHALPPLFDAASSFPLDSLRPVDGRIDVSRFEDLSQVAPQSAQIATSAAASVRALERDLLVAPLRGAVDDVGTALDDAATATDALARSSVLLPAMLGADGARDNLVLFQNNAEWRSLGGIAGAMALIHTDDGAMELTVQDSGAAFPRLDPALSLDDEVVGIYGTRPARWMLNVTQVPDFAVAGDLAREMWAIKHGTAVDSVIALDPVALSYILRATGPVELSDGTLLTADNATRLLLSEVYERYEEPSAQDAFFASVAAEIFAVLAEGRADPVQLIGALSAAADERRLLLWSAHDDEQAMLAETTLAGGLPRTDETASRFGVYLNDGTASKMDLYQSVDTTVAWESCTKDAAGTATGTASLSVTIANNAPSRDLPAHVSGAGAFGIPPGDTRTVAYVYLPEGFELLGATASTGSGFGGGWHEGRRVVDFTVDLAPGESATTTITAASTSPGARTLEALVTPTVTSVAVAPATCDGAGG